MSKMLAASCVGGVVTAEGLPIEGAVILSEGVGASTGVVVLDKGDAAYIPNTTPDLKTTLEKLSTALQNIASALSTLDGKPLGTLPPAPGAAGNIAAITAAKGEIDTLKGMLK